MSFVRRRKFYSIVLLLVAAFLILHDGAQAQGSNQETQDNSGYALTSLLYQTRSGVTLNYVQQGDPNGSVLLFLHGGGDSWHSYDRVYPLIPQRYRVYSITLRGHGLSDHPDKGYATADFAGDVLDFLVQKNIRNATLIGHSLGSFVAQKVVETDSSRIDRLVLIGSGSSINQSDNDHNEPFKFFATLHDPIPYSFARDFQASTIYAPVPAQNFEIWVAEAQKVSAATLRGIAHDFRSSPDALKAIHIPTLVLWGEKDSIFSRTDEDALVHALPNAKLSVYAETGHALHWERPNRFVSELLEFERSSAPQPNQQ
jgi:pimeloyl-ACP methyl ester carboxylesterase